jgi:SAM-dependent methyltransferase
MNDDVRSDQQRELFEAIHDDYSAHYYDRYATAYRDRFLHAAIFDNLDLDGKCVAEIMCGDGPLTAYLKQEGAGAEIEGYDISPSACRAYEEKTGCTGVPLNIVTEQLPHARYDVVAVSGGLHHVAHDLQTVFGNIHQSLRPGGFLVAFEPNARYMLNGIRNIWYRSDHYFDDDNEAALDPVKLSRQFANLFDRRALVYGGGPAFFTVYNSLILRLPLGLKRYYSAPMIQLERLWNLLPTPYFHGYFVAQWRKLG